jgi:hypothetical protein
MTSGAIFVARKNERGSLSPWQQQIYFAGRDVHTAGEVGEA